MIVKVKEAKTETDPLRAAGAKAEEQMAHYLKRAFENAPTALVYNDLRIPNKTGDDHAQLDHLIVFPRGMIVVESKSVSTAVMINDRDEWSRKWNGSWQGMPSPIQQARRQAEFLRAVLQENRESLRAKALFGTVQRGFNGMPLHILVAISDNGNIARANANPEVLKADQIVDRIKEIIAKGEKAGVLGWITQSDDDMWGALNADELSLLRVFLQTRHRPLSQQNAPVEQAAAIPPAPAPVALPGNKPVPVCKHCSSESIQITHGKFGYYFKCACTKNTPLDFACPQCNKEARIRKQAEEFFKECEGCGYSALFHTNS